MGVQRLDANVVHAHVDGDSQYFYATDADFPESGITDDLTIEMWINADSVTGNHNLLGKWLGAGNKRMYFFRLSADELQFFTSSDGAASKNRKSTNANIPIGEWVHIAVVYDASEGACTFYKNGGSLTDDGSALDVSLADKDPDFEVGVVANANYFDGSVLYVALWDAIRTPQEIEEAYVSPKRFLSSQPNIVAYWDFDDPASATAIRNGQGDSGRDLTPYDGGDVSFGECGRAVASIWSVDLKPIRGYNVPENRIRQLVETKAGKADSYEFGSAEKYEIPLINVTKADAAQLLSWWEDVKVLTFTPDQASSAQTFQMVIDGVVRPLNMWHDRFKSKYAGTVILHEVSSQSFSSSQVSLSKSKSCSSFDSSRSLGFESSLSCSAFLAASSRSSSEGYDDSYSTSRSCSQSVSVSESRSCSNYSYRPGGSPSTPLLYSKSCSVYDINVSLSSCEDQSSLGSSRSTGVIEIPTFSQSCSLDPSSSSLSTSAAGKSCSNSAGGIS